MSLIKKETQNVVSILEREKAGLQVIKTKAWSLPIYKTSISLDISTSKDLNIIEEFIFKLASTDIGVSVTADKVAYILGLDEVFTEPIIKKMLEGGALDKESYPVIKITNIGYEQFKNGQSLMRDKKVNLSVFINSDYNLYYSDVKQEETFVIRKELYKDNVDEIKNNICKDKNIIKIAAEIAKEKKIIVNKNTINQFVSGINKISINESEKKWVNFIETWVYDVVDKSLFCRVWNLKEKKFDEGLGMLIQNKFPINKEEFKDKMDLININGEKESTNIYEQEYINSIKLQRAGEINIKPVIKMLRGDEIKPEFEKCLMEAKNYLFIQSPWISESVIDENMMKQFNALAAKGCRIFISWGIAKSIDKEDRKPSEKLLNRLKQIKFSNGLPAISLYWIGNHHNKEIIVDNSKHLAGSFNWLSYRGDYLPRGESVYVTTDKNQIDDAKKFWENLIVDKIAEELFNDNYIRNISTLLRIENATEKANKIIVENMEYLFSKKIKDSSKKIYNIAVVYFKSGVLNDMFIKCILILIENNLHLINIMTMLVYLKKNNNAKLYDIVMDKYIYVFKKQNLIDSKMKVVKSINEKDIWKKLSFIEES